MPTQQNKHDKYVCQQCGKPVDLIKGKKIAPHFNGVNRCSWSGRRVAQDK